LMNFGKLKQVNTMRKIYQDASISPAYFDTVEVWGSSPHEPTTPCR
jgi:hypothetical protein